MSNIGSILGLASGANIEDFMSIELNPENGEFCFYVSKYKIWPYENGDFSVNYAKQECESLGLVLTPQGSGYLYPTNQLACKALSDMRLSLFQNS